MEKELFAHRTTLFKYAMKLCRNREAAEDLVQDTFVSALASKDSFEPGTNLGAWLSRILRNAFISQNRNPRRNLTVSENIETGTLFDLALPMPPNQEGGLMLRDFNNAVHTFLNGGDFPEIRARNMQFLNMVAIDNMSYDEVAESTGTPLGTVKNSVHRARAQLQELMG